MTLLETCERMAEVIKLQAEIIQKQAEIIEQRKIVDLVSDLRARAETERKEIEKELN